jgi:hypothetical protein
MAVDLVVDGQAIGNRRRAVIIAPEDPHAFPFVP